MKELNVMIAGLGGQGVVSVARILAEAAVIDGYKALTADVVGATQRYGATYSYVRIGDEVYSPIFPEGEADLLLGLEPLQCLKTGITFASEKCLIIMSDRSIGTGLTSGNPTLSDIIDYFKRLGIKNIRHFDAAEIALRETGNIVSLNMVMLGAALGSETIPVRESTLVNIIGERVPSGTAAVNQRAFKAGIKAFAAIS